jgi:tetratricopeptide (TPR) repeat protein
VLERRKKISKKQIKEDTLVTTYYRVQSFVIENQARLLIGVAAIALVVVAIVLFTNKRAKDNESAANLLAKVAPLYESGAYKEAIEGQSATNTVGLKKIVDDYGGTETGNAAKIFLANSYLLTNNNDAAYKAFDDYSGSNPLFKATALAGKAGCLETKKEYEKAADLFADAAKISKINPANADYLIRAGINYLHVGKKEEAKNLFETIKRDYKTSPVIYELDRYLAQTES